MTLKRRILALETLGRGPSRLIVAVGPAGFDAVAQLHERGVEVELADTLVVIQKPVGSPMTMSVDGRAC